MNKSVQKSYNLVGKSDYWTKGNLLLRKAYLSAKHAHDAKVKKCQVIFSGKYTVGKV